VQRLTQLLGTLLLLGGLWGVLMAIGWSAGVLPELPTSVLNPDDEVPPDSSETETAETAESETETPLEDEPGAEAPLDPVQPVAPEEEPPTPEVAPDEASTEGPAAAPTPLQAFILEPPGVDPHIASIVAGQLIGDETPELVVGLGDRVDVLQIEGGGLHRIATIHIEQAEPNFVPSTPRAGIGDVSGDGQADLVVPYWRRTVGGGSRGGGAVLLRGKSDGSLDRPRRFAGPRMMVSSLALMDLDGRGGLDVVLGGRGRPYGDIPGRIAFYRGGRMPRLIREERTAITEIRFVLPVDIDEDERRDLLVAGNTLVRYRRTGQGRFEALEDAQPGILFASTPHALSYRAPGSARFEALVHSNAARATVLVNAEGMQSVPESFQSGRNDVRLSWIRAVVPARDGPGREALAIHYVTNAWVLGRLDERGEPIAIRELHGGHPRSALDGTLVEEDGELVVYGLETLWDQESGAKTWHILRFPFCACDYDRLEAVEVSDRDSLAEWTIH
jgi:hypothetical protein